MRDDLQSQPALVYERSGGHLHGEHGAIHPHAALLQQSEGCLNRVVPYSLAHDFMGIWMQPIPGRCAKQGRRRIRPKHPSAGGIDIDDFFIAADENHIGRQLDELPVSVFAVHERLRCSPQGAGRDKSQREKKRDAQYRSGKDDPSGFRQQVTQRGHHFHFANFDAEIVNRVRVGERRSIQLRHPVSNHCSLLVDHGGTVPLIAILLQQRRQPFGLEAPQVGALVDKLRNDRGEKLRLALQRATAALIGPEKKRGGRRHHDQHRQTAGHPGQQTFDAGRRVHGRYGAGT